MNKSNKLSKPTGAVHDLIKESQSFKPYIEFGGVKEDSGERRVGRHVTGIDAYDLWHLAVRYKEVLTCRSLINSEKITIEDIPRKRKFLVFFLLLEEFHEVEDVVELGCSVLELIDGLELVEKYFQSKKGNHLSDGINTHKFIGIDSSDLMLKAAADIHSKHNLELFNNVSSMFESNNFSEKTSKALFDLNVSSYAFKTSTDLAKFLNTFDVGCAELALSEGDTFMSKTYSGLTFTYFSLCELISYMTKPLFFFSNKITSNKLWHLNNLGNSVINGNFLFGDSDRIYSFIENARKDKDVDKYFIDRGVELIEASKLLK